MYVFLYLCNRVICSFYYYVLNEYENIEMFEIYKVRKVI